MSDGLYSWNFIYIDRARRVSNSMHIGQLYNSNDPFRKSENGVKPISRKSYANINTQVANEMRYKLRTGFRSSLAPNSCFIVSTTHVLTYTRPTSLPRLSTIRLYYVIFFATLKFCSMFV